MKKYLLVATALGLLATPAMAGDAGVRVGPGGVTVGEGPGHYRERDRTVIRQHEPSDRTTVIKKDHGDGTRSKTVIHNHD